jgi:hypothetical protein
MAEGNIKIYHKDLLAIFSPQLIFISLKSRLPARIRKKTFINEPNNGQGKGIRP